jgi:uncharacterized protein YecE (DUF72 family)
LKKKGTIYIGTSGWSYKHWKGPFYPEGIRPADELSYYVSHFDSVELNNSFYRLPDRRTFEQWRDKTPSGFLFAVKASRYITHMKKLHDTKNAVQRFMHNAQGLEKKLGPVLFQLPPGWKVNVERLAEFLDSLPNGFRFAFEFRNTTWYTPEVLSLLKKFNCAFCIYNLEGHTTPLEVTADFVYIRLHGPGGKYEGSYAEEKLNTWAYIADKWQTAGKDVYIYFDNDQFGYAALNAKYLRSIISNTTAIYQ